MAGPLSPLKPDVPSPAARLKMPVLASNRRTTFPFPMVKNAMETKTLPAPSTATPAGYPSLRAGGRPAIAREATYAIARYRGDEAVWRNLADTVILGIRDEQVACGVHRHARRITQYRAGGGLAISQACT